MKSFFTFILSVLAAASVFGAGASPDAIIRSTEYSSLQAAFDAVPETGGIG